MVSEEKAKEIIRCFVYKHYDSLGYGKKIQGAGMPYYVVGSKRMTVCEYQDYCFKRALKKFDIK